MTASAPGDCPTQCCTFIFPKPSGSKLVPRARSIQGLAADDLRQDQCQSVRVGLTSGDANETLHCTS
ncbi:hypothetical protein WJX74_003289 [Apatococcus lobatus]|uniref:Uncharacterized protein n=1 Tax=Apatococcus lobatus TaxID=904363 RepID=A0AAW1Q5X3_9CHLO